MIRINFPDLFQILLFDGEVLEVFYGNSSKRVHLGHLESLQVDTDRKGNHVLQIATVVGSLPLIPFDAPLLPKVNELIAEVQRSKASLTL